MEGYYKHKFTDAVQIFSDTTVEILGGESEWEYLGEFDGTQEIETVLPKTIEVLSEEQQDRVRPVDTSELSSDETNDQTAQTQEAPKVEDLKGKGKKAITAEELDNE